MVGWREATHEALYGARGFYRRETPGTHFRTSVHASPLFGLAVNTLATEIGARTIVDMGSGRGELLAALHQLNPALTLVGVEVIPRPPDLPEAVEWRSAIAPPLDDVLVIANEWLDDVPVDVVEVDEAGTVRRVDVEPATGEEWLSEPVAGPDAQWLSRWWPLEGAAPGTRAEVGWPRDEAWAALVRVVNHGVLVAVDYSHLLGSRPPYGSLTAYEKGRQVYPIPDGSRDITSHVALDSAAAAGTEAGATDTLLTRQREALLALGLNGSLPSQTLARTDPAAYAEGLAIASGARELLASAGLGGFGWLLQGIHQPLPRLLV
jgi:SAM-dependent MidA family methyltransferase